MIHVHKETLTTWAGWLAAGTGAAIPVSVSATGVLAGLAILLGLLSGLYARHWRELLSHPVVLLALALFAWLALSLLYTPVPLDEALRVLKKYRELLLLPLLIPLLRDPAMRRWGLYGFIAAMLVTLALSYADALWQILDSGALHKDPEVFKKRITQSALLAFTAYWAWLQAARDPKHRTLWLLLVALIACNVFIMVSGRSGQLIFLALAALALVQRFRWRGLLLTAALGVLLLGTAYLVSEPFRDRVQESINGMRDYRTAAFSGSGASTALRISYYPNSLALIAERPVLGHGVGSFAALYARQVEGTPYPPTINPHNEYLLLAAQAGIPAALLLVLLFARQWRRDGGPPDARYRLLQGVLVTMAVGCLFNSFLLDSTEGHWYAYFSALLLYRPEHKRLAEPEDPG